MHGNVYLTDEEYERLSKKEYFSIALQHFSHDMFVCGGNYENHALWLEIKLREYA